MKLGINTYTCMWSIGFAGPNPDYPDRAARPAHPLTLFDLLRMAHDLGLRLLQTGPNLPVESLSAPDLERWIAQAQGWQIDLELGTRGLDCEHIARQIALACRMGARLIRTLPEQNGHYLIDVPDVVAALRPLVPMLEEADLALALENGRMPAADLRAALEAVGSPRVGVVLDMVNSLAVPEGWKEVTRLLAPFTMCVHYKDFTIRRAWHMMGFLCEGTPAGSGMLDPAWLLDHLRVSPFDYNVIIELWPPEQASLEATIALEQSWIVESVRSMRSFIRD
jgi:sugar phosphate isomerase/epimerase